MTTERLTDEALADNGLAAFAAYFRKNYPGPDTIIGNPDWHAPRIYCAAMDAHRRATTADDLRAAAQRAVDEWAEHLEDGDPVPSWVAPLAAALSQNGGAA